MSDFASRMIALARRLPLRDALEISAAPKARPGVSAFNRIGLWALVSDERPEAAMGLMTALAFLLERWRYVSVYRLFVALDEDMDPDAYAWDIADSQFDVDNWEPEGLDENSAVWGKLEFTPGQMTLTLEVENDASDDANVPMLIYTASEFQELVTLLPTIAGDIAAILGMATTRPLAPLPAFVVSNAESLEMLLEHAFSWERDLLLHLWGAEKSDNDFHTTFAPMLAAGQSVGGEFAAWLLSHSLARALLPTFHLNIERWMTTAREIVDAFTETPIPATILAPVLFTRERQNEAFALLDDALGVVPENIAARAALVELSARAGRVAETLATLQAAIQEDVADSYLYLRYGDIVNALLSNNLTLPALVLTQGDNRQPSAMLAEAVAAYDRVLSVIPGDIETLQRRAMLLFLSQDRAEFWDSFTRLVEADTTGEHIRAVVDSFELLDDVAPGVEILEDALEAHPDRADVRVNLAIAYLAAEEYDAALEQLEAAEELTGEDAMIADIERLFLSANDPDFEMRLGDMVDLLNAGQSLALDDIDYLEEALEQAQTFAQGYLLLARGYQRQGEAGAALETLLDGQKYLPEDPEITEQLARTLWDAGERDLAFDYLNKGLAHNSEYVPLLALTGRYLFEDGQADTARIFLSRAEGINPQDAVLRETQRYIVGKLEG